MIEDEKLEYLICLCKHCYKNSKLKVIASYTDPAVRNASGKPILWKDNGEPIGSYTIYFCFCEGCSRILLIDEPPWDSSEKKVMYPVDKRFMNLKLPESVEKSYYEAVGCEECKLPIATVIMVGRTLEAMIKQFIINYKDIFSGLEELRKQDIISSDIFEWGDELRVIRNLGVHDVDKKVEMTDAIEAMDFLQIILEIVYDLRPKFQKMKKRRERKDNSGD